MMLVLTCLGWVFVRNASPCFQF